MEEFPGWRPDPTGRHQERYFNSAGVPTVLVRNGGYESVDEDRAASGITTSRRPLPDDETGTTMNPWTEPSTVPANTYARLVSRYTAPAAAGGTVQQPVESKESVVPAGSPPATWRRRNWWLVISACVLAVFLIVASTVAVEQHNAANKWMNDYTTEVKEYHAEVHKDAALFAMLVSMQSQLSAEANQKG